MGIFQTDSYDTAARDLIEIGRFFHGFGWAAATSGNYSIRIADDQVVMTVSGCHKGELTPKDFLVVDLDGRPLAVWRDEDTSSAEARLHLQVYQNKPQVCSVLHCHTVASTAISRLHDHSLELADYEVFKAFPQFKTHEHDISIPIVGNSQDMDILSQVVSERWKEIDAVSSYLIRGHGLYTWGDSPMGARNQVEALDFLFQSWLLEKRSRRK
ncbi:MAG: methylthioribulose 1-phosphate dehydratase [Myxococcota bacterium]|nr:methylthioribulose 1-phosphate dehydratase [Myxococcota bacterium]